MKVSDPRLAAWLDKLDVTELVLKLARGIDRCDEALIASVFWPDATDDHGTFKGTAKDFVPWVIPVLRGMERTSHQICNTLVEVRGARAFSESYFIATHRIHEKGAARDMIAAGRYLDRCEQRGGEWRIAHRQTVYDYTTNQPASDEGWTKPPMLELIERGRRFGEDRSSSDKRAWLGAD
jgi:hypothetical protein